MHVDHSIQQNESMAENFVRKRKIQFTVISDHSCHTVLTNYPNIALTILIAFYTL